MLYLFGNMISYSGNIYILMKEKENNILIGLLFQIPEGNDSVSKYDYERGMASNVWYGRRSGITQQNS